MSATRMLRKLLTRSGSGGVSSVTLGLSSVGPPPTMKWVSVIPFSGAGNSAIWHLLGWFPASSQRRAGPEFGARSSRRRRLTQTAVASRDDELRRDHAIAKATDARGGTP